MNKKAQFKYLITHTPFILLINLYLKITDNIRKSSLSFLYYKCALHFYPQYVMSAQYSVWLQAGRPGDRGSIPGEVKGFFL
jgi:hypothetical protein